MEPACNDERSGSAWHIIPKKVMRRQLETTVSSILMLRASYGSLSQDLQDSFPDFFILSYDADGSLVGFTLHIFYILSLFRIYYLDLYSLILVLISDIYLWFCILFLFGFYFLFVASLFFVLFWFLFLFYR